jgi:hypothetical protein
VRPGQCAMSSLINSIAFTQYEPISESRPFFWESGLADFGTVHRLLAGQFHRRISGMLISEVGIETDFSRIEPLVPTLRKFEFLPYSARYLVITENKMSLSRWRLWNYRCRCWEAGDPLAMRQFLQGPRCHEIRGKIDGVDGPCPRRGRYPGHAAKVQLDMAKEVLRVSIKFASDPKKNCGDR